MDVVAQLNAQFRVVVAPYEPPQWLLQRLQPKTTKNPWVTISWNQTREGLLLAIREKVLSHIANVMERRRYPGLEMKAIFLLPDNIKFPDVRSL